MQQHYYYVIEVSVQTQKGQQSVAKGAGISNRCPLLCVEELGLALLQGQPLEPVGMPTVLFYEKIGKKVAQAWMAQAADANRKQVEKARATAQALQAFIDSRREIEEQKAAMVALPGGKDDNDDGATEH